MTELELRTIAQTAVNLGHRTGDLVDEVRKLNTKVQVLELEVAAWRKREERRGPPIGWVKHNGAGEIVFRQAGHPANDAQLSPTWAPVFT